MSILNEQKSLHHHPNDSSYGFYKYFHNVEKIYYGGSKEDWAVLTNNADRANIDAVEIILLSSAGRILGLRYNSENLEITPECFLQSSPFNASVARMAWKTQ